MFFFSKTNINNLSKTTTNLMSTADSQSKCKPFDNFDFSKRKYNEILEDEGEE